MQILTKITHSKQLNGELEVKEIDNVNKFYGMNQRGSGKLFHFFKVSEEENVKEVTI